MTEALPDLVLPLPRRIDRRMRLGPFPSARDAMKFAAYAAVGTLSLPFGGALAWLPLVGGAFLLSVYRPDGKGLDERAGDYLRWRLRRRRRRPRPGPALPTDPGRSQARVPGPYLVAVLEAGGVPTRFLPPADARELFDRYRTLLRSVGAGIHLEVEATPIPPAPYRLPRTAVGNPREQAARDGYEEMVGLLLRRRRRRRVRLVAFESALRGADAVRRLESQANALAGHLGAIGVDAARLRGARLAAAVEAIGWPAEGVA